MNFYEISMNILRISRNFFRISQAKNPKFLKFPRFPEKLQEFFEILEIHNFQDFQSKLAGENFRISKESDHKTKISKISQLNSASLRSSSFSRPRSKGRKCLGEAARSGSEHAAETLDKLHNDVQSLKERNA